MNCRMTRGIYLRANGIINCYCSTGEFIDLAQVPLDSEDFDFIKDVYWNENFQHIRNSFKNECLPFPDICMKCKYLQMHKRYEEEKAEKEIEWFHIEPSSVCNLACPFCMHGDKSKSDDDKNPQLKPAILSRKVFKKIVDDIAKHNYTVKWGYFQGRGEPGLNPKLWDMVKDIKDSVDSNFLVGTNGNIPFSEMIVLSGLDSFKIAVDSIIPEVYSRYRINGDLNKLFELTKGVVAAKKRLNSKTPEVVWQKVLFNFNDSDEELIEYQKKAMELGVNKLRIVYTFTKDFTEKRPHEFPKIFPNIEVYDARKEDNVDTKDIIEKFETAKNKKEPAYYIDVIANIIHSCELGTSNRKVLNKRALMELSDISLLQDEEGKFCDKNLIGIYQECLQGLAEAYERLGHKKEAERYGAYSQSIKNSLLENNNSKRGIKMKICKKCLQNDLRPKLHFDEEGICGACLWEEEKKKINWEEREKELKEIAEKAKQKAKERGTYDCVLGVSGGKDSTFAALYARDKLKLNCLLVNAAAAKNTDAGQHNVDNLLNLGFDMITLKVNPKILKKLIKKDFYELLNISRPTEYPLWASAPQIALAYNVPLIIQGENAALTLGVSKGETSLGGDASEGGSSNTRSKGTAVDLYVGREGVEKEDLFLYQSPSVESLKNADIQSIWLQYYAKEWSQFNNAQFAIKNGIKIRTDELEELGRIHKHSCLDSDFHMINQLFKYVKLGFGFATDEVCYDIREGRLSREEGAKLIAKYDGKCGVKFIRNFCDYIEIDEEEFWRVVDKFRNTELFEKVDGEWKLKEEFKIQL